MSELLISNYSEDCLKQIYEIYRPHVEEGNASFETEMPDLPSFQKKLNAIADKFPFLVLKDGNQILGYCYASTHRERAAYRWVVESSIYLHPSAQGKGLGALLYNHLFAILKKRNFTYALGGITLPNEASVGVHKKVGFEELVLYPNVGFKNGAWRSVIWLKKDLNEFENQPPEPVFAPCPYFFKL